MKKVGTSILISCLSDAVGAKLAEKLSNTLGLHFACSKDILEYDLFDSQAMLLKCGVEYLKKRERGAIAAIAEYENSVIYVSYDIFQQNEKLLKDVQPHIYLHVPKSKVGAKDGLNAVAYEDRDNFLKSKASLVISVNGSDENNLQKVLRELDKGL